MGAPSYPKLVRRFIYRNAEISVIEPVAREFTVLVVMEGKTPEMLFHPVRGGYFRSRKAAAQYAKAYARGKAWKPRPKKLAWPRVANLSTRQKASIKRPGESEGDAITDKPSVLSSGNRIKGLS